MAEYKLIQDGQPVAKVDGPDDQARREIVHYAFVYLKDGPVLIETKNASGRWAIFTPDREGYTR